MTDTAYSISNTRSGAYLGTYQADSAEAALDAMAREAGYKSHADACNWMPVEPGELRVTPVEPGESPITEVEEWQTDKAETEGLVTRDEAEAYLIAHPGARAEYAARGPVGGWTHTVCRIDAGELVQPHPTDLHRGPIAAPPGVLYRIIPAAEVAADYKRLEQQAE